jgi:hypothetical protein
MGGGERNLAASFISVAAHAVVDRVASVAAQVHAA